MTLMAGTDSWTNTDLVLDYCAKQLVAGRLTIVLGAGASLGFDLPDWDELMSRAFKIVGKDIPDGLSVENQAEYLQNTVFSGDFSEFARVIRESLYQKGIVGAEELSSMPLLNAIGALVMASTRGTVDRVITFNFDDLLEVYLSYYGYTVASIADLPSWANNSDVTVLHVHGLLPSDLDKPASKELILTQESFDKRVGRIEQLWTRKVTEIFEESFCLFIGLSGNDKNLTSLLSNTMHPTTDKYWGMRITANASDPLNSHWETRKVHNLIIPDWGMLPSTLFQIVQRAAKMRSSE